MVFVYVLQLERDKYYVGETEDPLVLHDTLWTKLYLPVRVLEMISSCDKYDCDKYTIKYMDLYGIHKVRGGSFTEIQLDESTLYHLSRMTRKPILDEPCDCFTSCILSHRRSKCMVLNMITDAQEKHCIRCGNDGHTISECICTHPYQNIS